MSMSELKAKIGTIIKEIEKLLPSTEQEIRSFGFSKWHMGAVLINDGFTEYAVLMHNRALLKKLKVKALAAVADRQILEEIDHFGRKFDVFCSVVADLGLMGACETATQLLHADILRDTRAAEDEARAAKNADLSSSQHTQKTTKKRLDTNRLYPFNSPQKASPQKVTAITPGGRKAGRLEIARLSPFNSPLKKAPETPKKEELKKLFVRIDSINSDESSYETIEEVITLSSYETVEREDDSSYETVEEIDPPSEYETDEEEIEVSEYETDSETDDRNLGGGQNKKSRRSTNANLKTTQKKGPKAPKKKDKPVSTSPRKEKKGSKGSKRAATDKTNNRRKPPPPPAEEEEEQQPEEGSEESASMSDASDGSDLPPPIKYGKFKPTPEPHPDPNYDPYKPTERTRYTKLKHYYHGDPNKAFLFRNKNKANDDLVQKKDPPKIVEPKPIEKRYRRIVRKQIIRTRRKLEKPPPTKIRRKKEKPPIKIRVRKERKVVKKKRVKKGTEQPIPKSIVVKTDPLLESSVPTTSPQKTSKSPKKCKSPHKSSQSLSPKKSPQKKKKKKNKTAKTKTSLPPEIGTVSP